jgi:Type III restriction enzyme, res subunit/Helicase conserved C-terminal domain
MPLASQCSAEVMHRMAELCSCLFIDEAHHVAAPTWKGFKDTFEKARIVQFTATPFRNDDQPIGGKRIFTFSLRHAQEQGYFKKIQFKPVMEFDPSRRDMAIAEAAVTQLRADAYLGHILMARVATVARAQEVFECYRGYTEFNPVQIHTGIKSKVERDEIYRKLLTGHSRIVVCVDMLGEGFDLPELKIAAFHDIRKTLAVTLQLVGRFTRTKPHLGDATFIANVADLEVKDELKRLYQHDSDWNALLPLIDEKVTDGEFNLWEFLGGFQELPEELTLRNVRLAMSTVVYRTKCAAWAPENFKDGIPGFDSLDKVYHTLNPYENTLVIVTMRRVSVDWAHIDEIYNWDWQLYVLHWDQTRSLLFIHNSSNAGFFKDLATAVADDVEQIRGPTIFRCLSGINRLKLQNVGLLEQLGRLIRYTMRAGSDIEAGLPEAQKQKAMKANLFGQGFENGHRSTIGCSYKGRIWSYKTTDLLHWKTWCRAMGERLLNESLDPEEVLRGTLVPDLVLERPKKVPIAVEWPNVFYKEPEQVFSFQINGNTVYRHEADLMLVEPTDNGPLKFAISSSEACAHFECRLVEKDGSPDYSIQAIDSTNTIINYRSRSMPLREFFEEEPPTFWFADGSSLSGSEYVTLRRQPEPFPRARIEEWDWAGTNIRAESQGIERNPESIQYRVIAEMKKRGFSVVFDDDDHGESADVVGVIECDDCIEVEFWHCKFAMANTPGARIKELYELCGQAQKSIRWLENSRDLFTHLMRREPRRYKGKEATRYEVGAEKDLLRIREKADSQQVRLRVFVVQPGLSKNTASHEQLELLAVTENYLLETFAVPFGVVASS